MADEITSEDIAQAALEPAAATVNGLSGTNRPLADLIAADKYLAAKRALSSTDGCGIPGVRVIQLKPPGGAQ